MKKKVANSRKEAIQLGIKRYNTGKPCKYGHYSDRNANGSCMECRRIPNAKKLSKFSPKEIRVILNMSPKEAHRITGRSIDSIYSYRSIHGVSKISKNRRWQDWEVALLGTMKDKEVAQLVKRPIDKVHRARTKRGIPPFKYCRARQWTSAEIKVFGTMPDAKAAEKLQSNPTTIFYERKKRGIPSFQQKFTTFKKWTKEEDDKLLARMKSISHETDERKSIILSKVLDRSKIAILHRYYSLRANQ